MRFAAVLLALLVAVRGGPGQQSPPIDEQLVEKALSRITPAAPLKKVAKLAGDEFEGRNAGYAGCRKAGDWIGEQLAAAKLHPAGDAGTFFQTFTFAARGAKPAPDSGRGPAGKDEPRDRKRKDKRQKPGKTPPVEKPLFDTPTTRNVIACLEGIDPVLKEEVFVVGGHYDHVGRDGQWNRMSRRGRPKGKDDIWNGADDNASGTAAVLEVAEAMAGAGLRLRRSVVFVLFSAEEHGLYGSKWYCDHPPYPLEKTVAMFNLDMVGYKSKRSVEVGGVDQAADGVLRKAIESATRRVRGFRADLRPWAAGGSSDHAPFLQHNVPAVFFFNGIHKDYHTIDDETDCVSGRHMANVARVVLLSLVELDRLDQKPAFVKAPAAAEGSGTLGISVGGNLTEEEAKKLRLKRRQGGVKVTSVYPSSPAGNAGVEPGDVIVALGREEIKQGREVLTLQNALRKLKPGQAFVIRVVRGTKRLSLRAEMP